MSMYLHLASASLHLFLCHYLCLAFCMNIFILHSLHDRWCISTLHQRRSLHYITILCLTAAPSGHRFISYRVLYTRFSPPICTSSLTLYPLHGYSSSLVFFVYTVS